MRLSLSFIFSLFLCFPCLAEDGIVVRILCERAQGSPSSGSGVVTSSDGHVLTAAHVMPDGSRCTASLGTASGERIEILREQVASGFDAALARLQTDQHFERFATFCPVKAELEITSVAFHPNSGDTPSRKPGIISKIELQNGALEVTNPVLVGESGGPLFLKGTTALVGIVQGQTSDSQGNPIRWMVPAAELQGFDLTPAVDCEPKEEAVSAEILAILEQLRTGQSKLLETANQVGVTDKQIVVLAQRINAGTQTPEEALAELENAVNVAIDIQKRGNAPSDAGPFVDEVLREVASLSNAGQLDAASERVNTALAQLNLAEESIRTAQLELLETGIATDVQRQDAAAAAAKVMRKLEIETEEAELFAALHEEQNRWYVSGRDKGVAINLEVAIALARQSVALAGDADQRGTAQSNLGAALATLGTRESSTSRLEEALVAYQAVLENWTRDRVPLEWAATQHNLGATLWTLGARESGTSRLEQAVTAYRAALEERTRSRVPLAWAMTQNNLGTALQTLGERESGVVRLEQAVEAFRAVLQEWSRDKVPLEWAGTQNNLGVALATLGARESSTARLKEAVTAYRAALEEQTRGLVPLAWAGTQTNLGAVLTKLGERDSSTVWLQEALAAYRLALEEMTRDRVPLDWAAIHNNLGITLRELGIRENDTARLKEAVEAYRAALEERTRSRVPLAWAMTQNNLGLALATLGERESGTARLKEAVKAYRAALEEWTRDRVPLDWARIQNNLGAALSVIGERESSTARIEEALAAYRAAMEERVRDRVPLDWAETLLNMALAKEALFDQTGDLEMLSDAIADLGKAREVYADGDISKKLSEADNSIMRLKQKLSEN